MIDGNFTLIHSENKGIIDDGTLAQKIAEILQSNLAEFGVGEVTVDFEKSAKF